MISYSTLRNVRSLVSSVPDHLKNRNLRLQIDSRKWIPGEAFCVIPGTRVHPLDIIDPLIKKGLDAIFIPADEKTKEISFVLQQKYPDLVFLSITDPVVFIQDVSSLYVNEFYKNPNHVIFGISGSNGKTTHKEMLYHLLSSTFPDTIVTNDKNHNNHLGVPLTILKINSNTKCVVLELGSNHPGEIKFLCELAHPNCGITTNVGATHLEFFDSVQDVFQEESFLYNAVKVSNFKNKFFIINDDDNYLKELADTDFTLRVGKNYFSTYKLSKNSLQFTYMKESYHLNNSLIFGEHNWGNLVNCVIVAHKLYPEFKSKFEYFASTFKPTHNRSEIRHIKNVKIFLDAYNANPSSMQVALKAFKKWLLEEKINPKKCLIILGDMNELGNNSKKYHHDLGKYLSSLEFGSHCFIGRFAAAYQDGFGALTCKTYESVQNYHAKFKAEYTEFDAIFIKGSRSLQLESLLDIT